MSIPSYNSSNTVNTCLNILKRCTIKDTEKIVMDLSDLVALNELKLENPYIALSILSDVDLKDSFKRNYIQCEYNRVGDSFRSPWTNTWHRKSSSAKSNVDEDQYDLPESLRKLEIQYNEIFASYRDAYYGKEAISSVYIWDTNTHSHHTNSKLSSQGFSACFVIKKILEAEDKTVLGFWNSLHVVHIGEISDGLTSYKMTSTAYVSLRDLSVMNDKMETLHATSHNKCDNSPVDTNKAELDAALTRQAERNLKVHDGNHLVNIGKMIEDTENDIRSSLDSIYIPKTKEIVETLHCTSDETSPKSAIHRERKQQKSMELNEEMLARILKKSVTSPL